MKRILIYFLLIANLFTGLAFAWDSHPEAVFGHDAVVVDVVDQNSPSPGGDEHTDHHCCHGAAHLLAIVRSESVPFSDNAQHHLAMLRQSQSSLYITPLLRPPII